MTGDGHDGDGGDDAANDNAISQKVSYPEAEDFGAFTLATVRVNDWMLS
jgi:hypothetical protein